MPTIHEWIEGVDATGVALDRRTSNRYRARRGLPPLPMPTTIQPPTQARQPQRTSVATGSKSCCRGPKPGTELRKLLKSLDIPTAWCESCQGRAATMDARGVAWCKENRAAISAWLGQAEKDFALASARAERTDGTEPTDAEVARARDAQRWRSGWAAAKQLIWINPLDPFGSLVDEAIRRAEESEKACATTCEA